jgi:simple sugar transport system ATP-binding protein
MVLRVDNVGRRFGSTVACDDVSLTVEAGEVVVLLGENGAGKSTLLSIIAGFVAPDRGTVSVAGEVLPPGDPGSALRAGVGTAFQHFSLAPELRVSESFELARLDADEARLQLPSGFKFDSRVGDLTVPERQQVEFLKARMLARRVLLLDEPTSLLGDDDVLRVLRDIRDAADAGIACVLVTHRLHEALAVADRILVMRHGYVVERMRRPDRGWPDGTRAELLAAMFGDAWVGDADEVKRRPTASSGGELVFSGMLGSERIDISLESGRALAVAGIAGNGQQDLVALLSGAATERVAIRDATGERVLRGGEMRRWVEDQVAVVPEDRFHEGGSTAMPLSETLVLRDLAAGRLSRWGFVRRRAVRARARAMIVEWSIQPPDEGVRFGMLSGGNAQRVLLARALDPLPDVLVAVRPTHGLDHHSVEMVRAQLREAAEAGTAVVTIEQELDDALQHADTVALMYRGRLSPAIPADQADRAGLQAMMVSGWGE